MPVGDELHPERPPAVVQPHGNLGGREAEQVRWHDRREYPVVEVADGHRILGEIRMVVERRLVPGRKDHDRMVVEEAGPRPGQPEAFGVYDLGRHTGSRPEGHRGPHQMAAGIGHDIVEADQRRREVVAEEVAPHLVTAFDLRREGVDHLPSSVGQGIGGPLDSQAGVGVDRSAGQVGRDRRPPGHGCPVICHVDGPGIPGMASDGDAQHGLQIGDAARHRTGDRHELAGDHRIGGVRRRTGDREPPQRGLGGGDATAVGGVADRTPEVGSHPHRGHARGDGRGLSARRAAGRPVRVPRVPGQAEQGVVGGEAHTHLGKVGLSDGDGPRCHQSPDSRVVEGGDPVGKGLDAIRGGVAGQVQAVLDRHGHTMERAGGEPCGSDPVGCIGGAPCRALQEQHGGVQPAVHLVDAFKVGVYHLPAGHLTVGDHGCQLQRGPVPENVIHHGNLTTVD